MYILKSKQTYMLLYVGTMLGNTERTNGKPNSVIGVS